MECFLSDSIINRLNKARIDTSLVCLRIMSVGETADQKWVKCELNWIFSVSTQVHSVCTRDMKTKVIWRGLSVTLKKWHFKIIICIYWGNILTCKMCDMALKAETVQLQLFISSPHLLSAVWPAWLFPYGTQQCSLSLTEHKVTVHKWQATQRLLLYTNRVLREREKKDKEAVKNA